MFSAKTYQARRSKLLERMGAELLLFVGNDESAMNYPANTYLFRQDSSFLYYWGLDEPGLVAVINGDKDETIIFGDDISLDDVIWMGPQLTIKEKASQVGVEKTAPLIKLKAYLDNAVAAGTRIHYLPPYRSDTRIKLSQLLTKSLEEISVHASAPFIKAVVSQREVKSVAEVRQIEMALDVAYEMQINAMRLVKPAMYEHEIAGAMEGIARAADSRLSFPTIYSIHGETLHNHYHGHQMQEGNLVVNDSGAESPLHYASDITRTVPVGAKFTARQREIYEVVLGAQLEAIQAMRPDTKFKDVHLLAAKVIATGLKEIGLIKGEIEAAVAAGAHALFFPHGLGHMIGLDVHDMENLGEQYVGYDENTTRSDQFGLSALRLGKTLKPGFVVTIEPGVYFIPELIDRWQADKKHAQYIDYERVADFRDFGGIRIEDDVLVTHQGQRVLGRAIPKSIDEVEKTMGTE